MKKVMWFILDSVGIGGAPDAAAFGDVGSDTLGHIAEWFIENEGRALALPNLEKLGLGEAYRLVHGSLPTGWKKVETPGYFAAASEVSTGKDTPSGHWELAGVPARWDWGYFPKAEECFPQDLLEELWKRGGLDGSLGHCHASGTEIIERLGEESVRSGKPIFYTSADSVFQIAAHEEAFGLDRLLKLCELARELTLEMNIGRVIARPFIGEAGGYERTANRKDYAVTPPKPTVLQRLLDDGKRVAGVGKIGDIFAHTGMSVELKASGHPQLWEKTREARQGSDLVMTNFVDFDMLYGHRRDPLGYGLALEEWDRELGKFLAEGHDDLIVITADHGNDPTWEGTDHTRERVPVLIHGAGPGNGGIRETFADVGATIAKSFGLKMDEGTPIL
ncbi:phosphopentomutase [Akkermansiaceae bacterium]|nr:phosphopentomutase [Akkermansiaceae bacterium]